MLNDWYSSFVKTPPKAAQATAAQAGTTTWEPGKDATVQGQLVNVLDAGGPLMDRATTRANQQMNARGLLNSSIAVGAGQSALYDAALPIAQQDAQTKAAAGQFNANASNTANLTNAGLTTDVSRSNAQEQNNMSGLVFGKAADSGLEDKRQQFTAFQANLEREQQTRIQQLQEGGMDARQARQLATQEALTKLGEAGVQNRFDAEQALRSKQFDVEQVAADRRLAQQHANELERLGVANKLNLDNVPANMAAQTSFNTLQAVNTILADPNLTPEAKKGAVQNAVDYANSNLAWLGTFYKTAFPPMAVPGQAPMAVPGQVATGTQRPPDAAPPGVIPLAEPAQIPNNTDMRRANDPRGRWDEDGTGGGGA